MSIVGLKLRMFLLVALLFAFVFGIISVAGEMMGIGSSWFYLIISLGMMFLQYMLGPKLIEWMMRIKYVTANEYPRLHSIVNDLSVRAGIPMPKVAISSMGVPNAFAFGRSVSDGRVCVTQGILDLLSEDELRAVLAHEISHIKNRDVLTITLLSVIPIILYRIALNTIFSGGNRRREEGANLVLIGILAMVAYFVANLLVLYASRIREYFADRGAVSLGCAPKSLATALYKLVYGSARADKDSLTQTAGLKAFFINDPSRALNEIKELRELDLDKSGTIDASELIALSGKNLRLGFGERLLEVISTHPNMLKRIKQLSTYSVA